MLGTIVAGLSFVMFIFVLWLTNLDNRLKKLEEKNGFGK